MEIWDPFTGIIYYTSSALPQEIGPKGAGTLMNFQIVSLNQNTELLFVGGDYATKPVVDNVWKFRYLSEKWTNVGKLKYPIKLQTSFVVKNVICP